MNFTHKRILWKSDSTNSIVPTNSRPFTNNDPNLQYLARNPLKANPIKHWRKQLQPVYKTKSSKHVSIRQLDAPNSVIYVGSSDTNCDSSLNNMQLLKENVNLLNNCIGTKFTYDDMNDSIRCVGGSSNIRRSANTNVKPNYYQNYSKYLQSKCKTYDENSKLGQQNDDGTYKSSKCSLVHLNCNKPIIYKPSNSKFHNQGSVTASSYLLRKKNNALTNNSASLKSAYGNTYVNVVSGYSVNSGYNIKYVKGDNNLKKNLCYSTTC